MAKIEIFDIFLGVVWVPWGLWSDFICVIGIIVESFRAPTCLLVWFWFSWHFPGVQKLKKWLKLRFLTYSWMSYGCPEACQATLFVLLALLWKVLGLQLFFWSDFDFLAFSGGSKTQKMAKIEIFSYINVALQTRLLVINMYFWCFSVVKGNMWECFFLFFCNFDFLAFYGGSKTKKNG